MNGEKEPYRYRVLKFCMCKEQSEIITINFFLIKMINTYYSLINEAKEKQYMQYPAINSENLRSNQNMHRTYELIFIFRKIVHHIAICLWQFSRRI